MVKLNALIKNYNSKYKNPQTKKNNENAHDAKPKITHILDTGVPFRGKAL